MTQEKEKSLLRYVSELTIRINSPVPPKHVRRGSGDQYRAFLEQELDKTKKTLAASKV